MSRPLEVKNSKIGRIRQGDIYRDIEYIEYIKEVGGVLEISKILFPHAIVLSQDCDLESDYLNRKAIRMNPQKDQDKFLFSILVVPFFNVEHFRVGSHFSELNLEMRNTIDWSGTEGNKIKNNEIPRYHYLLFPEDNPLPNSVIDFKHFFTVNFEFMNKSRRKKFFVCSVSELFREEISQRFAYYLSRIGLPPPKIKMGQS